MSSHPSKDAQYAPDLSEHQGEQLAKSAAIGAPVVHEAIRLTGEDELRRSTSALAWSGLAAGLSMGFSLVTEGILRSRLPAAEWAPLVTKVGYSFGFLVVILGRQQLFTENTLTAVIPLLARRDLATLRSMLRLWAVVLATNLVGALAIAWVLGNTDAFEPQVKQAFVAIAERAAAHGPGTLLLRGIFAGWIIALMVWMLPAARNARVAIIILLTWLVGAADLSHIVAGSVEVLFLSASGRLPWTGALFGYMAPTLAGNVLGGVSLVAALNHAQVVSGEPKNPGTKRAGTEARPYENRTDRPPIRRPRS